MRVLTVGTVVEGANNPGAGWTVVNCQFCGTRMYCLEKNSKVKPGDELVLSCNKCLVQAMQVDEVPESNPWSEEWKN